MPVPTLLDHTGAPFERKAAPVSGVSAPEPWFMEALGIHATASKVVVSPSTAMRVPAVARAVNLIAGTIGILPARVFKVAADEARTPATEHPAFGLVHRFANPFTSARELRQILTRDALLHGDGFAAVVRDGSGRPRELVHLPPGTCTADVDLVSREPFYRVSLTSGSDVLSWRDVLHLKAPSLDGIRGASPTSLGREAIGLALVLEAYAARLFGNGARPGGIISVPGKLGDTAGPRMKASWQAAFSGEGTGGTAVLEEGATFSPVALTSVDAEFMAQRRHQVREVANVFGLPSTMLGDTENQTYSNVEGLAQSFRDETLLPWIAAWEDAYARVLLDESELSTHAVAFDLEALDRADLAAKAEAIAKRRAAGITTANEERRSLNLPAHANGNELGSPFTTANEAPAHNE
ncbi:phage portal protein [Methylobacterium oryzisoli]|uniref:phage portal protein n=1 Tax=Methylobacterium oryzisoli TaxID=3385502 RepID=UPI00397C7C09